MCVWNCKAIDMEKDEEVSKSFEELLDCILETESEVFHFCLDSCLSWCRVNNYLFVSFEVITM